MKNAVAYLRRSTTGQEASLEDQRKAIEAYALANGFKVNRYYSDDYSGASGNRQGFQKMLTCAENGRDFDYILCYDLSRFGRMNTDESGYYRHRFSLAGVEIITVMEAERYANAETAEILRPIEQVQHRNYLKKVSSDVLRGMKSTASKGHWAGGDSPYGFKRVMFDSQGKELADLSAGETTPRREGFHVELRPDPIEAKTVQWIFNEYVNTLKGFKTLASDLNSQGKRTRNGKLWGHTSIKSILENPAYTGDIAYGRRSSGKFNRIDGQSGKPNTGLVRKRRTRELAPKKSKPTRNPKSQWTIHKNAHPAIISRETFRKAQEKKQDRTRHLSSHTYTSPSPLSGLLVCGHCGRPMWLHKGNGKKSKKYRYYRCSSYDNRGRQDRKSIGGCQPNTIRTEPLDGFISKTIQDAIKGEIKDTLQREIESQLTARQKTTPDSENLKAELRKVENQIETGTARYLTLDNDTLATAAKKQLDTLADKADSLKRQIEAAESAQPRTIDQQLDIVLAELDTLGTMLDGEDPQARQKVYNTLIESITLWFKPADSGRTKFTLDHGQLKLKVPATLQATGTISKDGRGGQI